MPRLPPYFKQATNFDGNSSSTGPFGSQSVAPFEQVFWVKLTSLNSAGTPGTVLPSYCWTQVSIDTGGTYGTDSGAVWIACGAGTCSLPTGFTPSGLVYASDENDELCDGGATPIVQIVPRGTLDANGLDEWIIANNAAAPATGLEVVGSVSGDITGITKLMVIPATITGPLTTSPAMLTIVDASPTQSGIVNSEAQNYFGQKTWQEDTTASTGYSGVSLPTGQLGYGDASPAAINLGVNWPSSVGTPWSVTTLSAASGVGTIVTGFSVLTESNIWSEDGAIGFCFITNINIGTSTKSNIFCLSGPSAALNDISTYDIQNDGLLRFGIDNNAGLLGSSTFIGGAFGAYGTTAEGDNIVGGLVCGIGPGVPVTYDYGAF